MPPADPARPLPDLATELLTEIRDARRADHEARAAQLRTLERIADGADRHEHNAATRSGQILAALGQQEQREAVVAERLAEVTRDGKRDRFAVVLAVLRAFPPPLKKALTSTATSVVSAAGVIIVGWMVVHFGVPTSTLVAVAQAVVQPLAAGAAPVPVVEVAPVEVPADVAVVPGVGL